MDAEGILAQSLRGLIAEQLAQLQQRISQFSVVHQRFLRKYGMPLEAFVRALEALEEQPVERFHPQQVILFGSHACGTPTPDNDVGLHFPFPVDLLVRMPQHIAERIAMGDVFLREVFTQGVVLYAAKEISQPKDSRE
jgi:hypothetical protein